MSQRLVGILAEEFRDSTHVTDIGLRGMEDARIWTHSRAHGFAIVSKDSDFRERSYVEGFPPKVIWLDVGTADRLISSATRVEGEAVDLYHFTSVIMRSVNEEGRLKIVEMMWEMVYADGQVTEFEDNVVWRAADLLGISSRDRIDLKHRVAERQGQPLAGVSKQADIAT